MSDKKTFFSDYEKNLFEVRYANPANPNEDSWSKVFRRVADTVSNGNADMADVFFDLMNNGMMIPSSPQLWNYGADRRHPKNGSSCFTLRMGDTLDDFREADASAEAIYVASGGAGVLLNSVRPRGTHIRHMSEGAMGSMCAGGPALRLEGTTGYITGAGRARGALMLQLSAYHPDAIEFILSKIPMSLGFLDDWRSNAWSVLGWNQPGAKRQEHIQFAIERFYSHWVDFKEWPLYGDFVSDLIGYGYDGVSALMEMEKLGIVKMHVFFENNDVESPDMRVIPMVTDWSTGDMREANRDWNLPLQNCNMSIRVPDELMHAVENDLPWVFHWFDSDPPKETEHGWTKTDAVTGELEEFQDGRYFAVDASMTDVDWEWDSPPYGGPLYRYGVVITTWEGLRKNLSPNQNMWRDTDYARFYRKVVLEKLKHLSGPIMARQVWRLITEMAHSHADPGIVFESTYERFQPISSTEYGPRLSNPCSEYVNSAGGSCNLASVNLRYCAERVSGMRGIMHVTTEDQFKDMLDGGDFDEYAENVMKISRKTLNYITSAMLYNQAPVDYIDALTRHHFRTVGVGMMGLAEAMMLFGIDYGSKAAECFSAYSMALINLSCWEESFFMASYGGYQKPLAWNSKRMARIFTERQKHARKYGLGDVIARRYKNLQLQTIRGGYATHTAVTSVAPTGTISMIAGWVMTGNRPPESADVVVTSGCEPPFDWSTFRQDNSGKCIINHDLWHGGMKNMPWMKTSSQVSAEEHIHIQAAVAAFTCMSVSKTVNLPNEASVDDVSNAYKLAWKLGIPGTAIYRDHSKPMQVLSALDCPSGECGIKKKVEDSDAHAERNQLSMGVQMKLL